MTTDRWASLTPDDIWVFTKQSVAFDTAFLAAKLLCEMPAGQLGNVEDYFAQNHLRYGIDTARHRVLVIAQLYGLLTKTPLYHRGGSYANEQVTEVFERLNGCEFGGTAYNELKTEQLLKVKIRAIIDTADNNIGWDILPVLYSYQVLKKLQQQHGMTRVDLDSFYTYVMSCKDYGELDASVYHLASGSPVSPYVGSYKDRSRFVPLVDGNCKLFCIGGGYISLNEQFDDYFYRQFVARVDIEQLNSQLASPVDYTYLLTTCQGYGVNLIDPPPKAPCKKPVVAAMDTEREDSDYVARVNAVKEENIRMEIVADAYRNQPAEMATGSQRRYSKNPLVGKVAVHQAGYRCANDARHQTFVAATTGRPFMEAHHLIPINRQAEMWQRYHVNIDCVENIVALCPNCHRAVHYAAPQARRELITKLYYIQKPRLWQIGVTLTLEELLELYGL